MWAGFGTKSAGNRGEVRESGFECAWGMMVTEEGRLREVLAEEDSPPGWELGPEVL
jgi:hypothetical protein